MSGLLEWMIVVDDPVFSAPSLRVNEDRPGLLGGILVIYASFWWFWSLVLLTRLKTPR